MTVATVARAAVRIPETAAEAQLLVDNHLHSTPLTGRCLACHEPAPCPSRELAHVAFRRLGELPRRTFRLPDPAFAV
jgi:hypothetical protein